MFNGPFSGTTQVSRYHKCKTNLDFSEARDSEWQWHQLGHMQVCTMLQTDNHTSTPPLCFLQAGCLSCHPTNNVKAVNAKSHSYYFKIFLVVCHIRFFIRRKSNYFLHHLLAQPAEHWITSRLRIYEKYPRVTSAYSYQTLLCFHTVHAEPLLKQYSECIC